MLIQNLHGILAIFPLTAPVLLSFSRSFYLEPKLDGIAHCQPIDVAAFSRLGGISMFVCVGAFIIYSFSFYHLRLRHVFSLLCFVHKKIEFFIFFVLPGPPSKGKRLLVEMVLLVVRPILSFYCGSSWKSKEPCNAGILFKLFCFFFASLCTVCAYIPNAMQLKLRNFSSPSARQEEEKLFANR